MEDNIMIKKKLLSSVYVSVVLLIAGCSNKNNIDNAVKETNSEVYTVGDVNKTDSYVYVSATSAKTSSENENPNESASNNDIESDTTVNETEINESITHPDLEGAESSDTESDYVTDTSDLYSEPQEIVSNNTSEEIPNTPAQDTEQDADSVDIPATSGSYIINTYGSYDAYAKEVIKEINKLRASYGYEPLTEHVKANEVAYKVNCEQSATSTGHWTAEQRPSLQGIYRNLESIGAAADLFWSDYADPAATAYDLTMEHTKGIVTKPEQKYIGISVLPCSDVKNYIVITIESYSETTFSYLN